MLWPLSQLLAKPPTQAAHLHISWPRGCMPRGQGTRFIAVQDTCSRDECSCTPAAETADQIGSERTAVICSKWFRAVHCGPSERLVMRSSAVLVLLLWSCKQHSTNSALFNLKAKFVARARVSGPGFALRASNVKHCLALCNKRPDQCDAVNFYVPTGKCRLFERCAPISIGPSSSDFYFYSKRPQSK
jgi:hypothetical protein